MHPLLQILYLAAAAGAVAMTVSKAKVFKGLRAWLRTAWPWFGELIGCPYCTSHWVAFVLVAAYRPRPLDSGFLPLDLAVAAMAVVALAACFSGLIFLAFRFMPREE